MAVVTQDSITTAGVLALSHRDKISIEDFRGGEAANNVILEFSLFKKTII